jgi:HSP20 family protein
MRALRPWSRYTEPSLWRDFDDLVARLFADPARATDEGASFRPPVEWFTRGEDLVLRADLPGIDPKHVDVSVEGDQLTIKGERKEVTEGGSLHREVRYGRFERSVRLPERVEVESMKATYRDGVLELTMRAPSALVSRKVPITVH